MIRCRLLPLVVAPLIASLAAARAGAQAPSASDTAWTLNGVPICRAGDTQFQSAIAPDGQGGAIIAWRDRRSDFGDIYAQRVTALGAIAPGWPANGLAACAAPGNQQKIAVASDGEGGAYIAWEDFRTDTSDVYAQHIKATGEIASGWPADGLPVSTAFDAQYAPTLCPDGSGGVYMAWDDLRISPLPKIYLQRLTGSGAPAPGWPDGGIAPIATDLQLDAAMVLSDSGSVLFAWSDGRNGGSDIYALRLTAEGTPAAGWPADGVPLSLAAGEQVVPSITSDGEGGAIVVWHDNRAPSVDLYAQRVTNSGGIKPGWPPDGQVVCAVPGEQFGPGLVGDGAGGALIAWQDGRSYYDINVYAQHLLGDGSMAPGWADNGLVLCAAPDNQQNVSAVPDGSGGLVACWDDGRNGDGIQVFAQRVTFGGVVGPGWPVDGLPICGVPGGSGFDPAAAADGLGGAIIVWTDNRIGYDIWAQRVGPDGAVPALLSLLSASAEPDRVGLIWHAGDGASFTAGLERREPAGEWSPIATLTPGSDGTIRYEDRAVAPGARYGYRLRVSRAGVAQSFGEVWVEVPSGLALALRGFEPNPAEGELRASFTLPDGAPARLEVYDVSGRRLMAREVGNLGAGSHLVRLGEAGVLRPGIYVVRLAQAGRSLVAKGCVVR